MKNSELIEEMEKAQEIIIKETANELKNEVAKIEAKPIKTTKDSYGEYLRFMSIATDNAVKIIIAKALVEAGANPNGVRAALELSKST